MDPELANAAMADVLKSYRARAGWTQEKLAAKSGLNLSTLKRILNAERDINVTQITALADAFAKVPKLAHVSPALLMSEATAALEAMSAVPANMSDLQKKREEKQAEARDMSPDQLAETKHAAITDDELGSDEPQAP